MPKKKTKQLHVKARTLTHKKDIRFCYKQVPEIAWIHDISKAPEMAQTKWGLFGKPSTLHGNIVKKLVTTNKKLFSYQLTWN